MQVNSNVRNVAIVVALAALVAFVPGGGYVADVLITAVSLAFLAALGWIGSLMYREHRTTLYSLGDNRRAALYCAVGVLAVTLTATSRLTSSGLGSVAWLVLVGSSIYVGVAVLWAARRY
jgi:hypothetical protein